MTNTEPIFDVLEKLLIFVLNTNKEGNWVNNNQTKTTHYAKVVFVGLGATPVFKRYLEDFDEATSVSWHVGFIPTTKLLSYSDKEVKMQIWNLRSDPRYRKVRKGLFPGTFLVIFFQQNDQESFIQIPTFFNDFKTSNQDFFSRDRVFLINLLSPIVETEQVTSEAVNSLVSSLGVKYYEMHVDDKIKFDQIFSTLAKVIISSYEQSHDRKVMENLKR